jgi:hypothetical protein
LLVVVLLLLLLLPLSLSLPIVCGCGSDLINSSGLSIFQSAVNFQPRAAV